MTKRKTTSTLLWISAILIILMNTPPAQFFLQENFTYRNKSGTFHYSEEGGKGKSYQGCKKKYNHFLSENPEEPDKTLYRTFTIKWWLPWNWYQLLFNKERFQLPYLNTQTEV